jgi:hypothetical protein
VHCFIGHCKVEVNQGLLEGNDWVGSVDQSPVFRTQIYSVITGHSQLMGVFPLNLTIPYKEIVKTLATKGHMQHDEKRLTKKERLPGFKGTTDSYVILPSLFDEAVVKKSFNQPEVKRSSTSRRKRHNCAVQVSIERFLFPFEKAGNRSCEKWEHCKFEQRCELSVLFPMFPMFPLRNSHPKRTCLLAGVTARQS